MSKKGCQKVRISYNLVLANNTYVRRQKTFLIEDIPVDDKYGWWTDESYAFCRLAAINKLAEFLGDGTEYYITNMFHPVMK